MNGVLVLFTAFAACCYAAEKEGRIIAGDYAADGSYQYTVALRNNKLEIICGGAAVRYNWIITSAQCKEATYVSGGDTKVDQQCFYRIDKKIVHGDFDPKTLLNDIMLVKTAKYLTQYYYYSYPTVNIYSDKTFYQNTTLSFKVMGWGQYYPNSPLATSLVEATYKFQSVENCTVKNTASGSNLPYDPDTQICGSMNKTLPTGSGICTGDIGNPLMMDSSSYYNLLVGIASRTMKSPCGTYPDVFTKISPYYNWIYSTMNYL